MDLQQMRIDDLADAAFLDPEGVRIELERRAARGSRKAEAILAFVKALG